MLRTLLIGLALGVCFSAVLLVIAAAQRRRQRRTGRIATVTPAMAVSLGFGAALFRSGVELLNSWRADVWVKSAAALLVLIVAVPVVRALRRWWHRSHMTAGTPAAAGATGAVDEPAPASQSVDGDAETGDAALPERYLMHCDKDHLAVFGVLIGLAGLGAIAVAAFKQPFQPRVLLMGLVGLLSAVFALKRVRDPRPEAVLDATGLWHRIHGSIAWQRILAVRAESLSGNVVLVLDLLDEDAWWAGRPRYLRVLRAIAELRGVHGIALGRIVQAEEAHDVLRRFLARYGARG